jgi:outer membrane protein assembly factor BamB
MDRDGAWREAGILETFPADGLKIAWRAEVGNGWSSPVIAQGRVFVMDAGLHKPKAQERVHCLDDATGKELWTHAYDVTYPDWAFSPEQSGGPTSTPCVRDGRIFTLGQRGDVFCLDARTGAVLWHRNMIADYQMKEFTGNTSPLIEGKMLILAIGGKPGAGVIALDVETGREIWRSTDEDQTNSSPVIITAAGRRQLIVWLQQSVSSLDPATGGVLWREPLLTLQDSAVATPVTDGSLLLIGGMMFKLDADKPGAAVLWPDSRSLARRILSNTSTAILRDGHVYSARSNGELVCLDALTGRQLWTTDTLTDKRGGFGASIHLTPNGSSVLLYNDRGELIRAKLSPGGCTEISRALLLTPSYKFGGKNVNWSPPAWANGRVFARNERELVSAKLDSAP